jgi:hypothetical protein
MALPPLLRTKLYKTGQTRGATNDEIFQNRVSRCSTVLIPYACWQAGHVPPEGEAEFACGSITLIDPTTYFAQRDSPEFAATGLELGRNLLVFYERRRDWVRVNPATLKWTPATSRVAPLGGQYVARISATTAETGQAIFHGFTNTAMKGAGIRVYEYANERTILLCRRQLELLFWRCHDSLATAQRNGMSAEDAASRRAENLAECEELDLNGLDRLIARRLVNADGNTVCPLCLEPVASVGFFERMDQAVGREVFDLTVTNLNLFHIDELRVGRFGHLPYNLGWGHHHCNVVVKDAGILPTLAWMTAVLERNRLPGMRQAAHWRRSRQRRKQSKLR